MANSKAKLLKKLMAKQKGKLPLPPITPPPAPLGGGMPPMGGGMPPMGGGMPPQQPPMGM